MDSEKSGNGSTDKRPRPGSCKPGEPICSTVRLQRNQAEKQRRDRFNGYISELGTIVPMVKNSSKPVDKVSVLRLAAAHMRLKISCLNAKNFKSQIPALPASLNSYLELVEKNIGGFIVVTTFTGTVLFCSKCIEDFVGYQSIDVIGQSIYNYVDSKEVPFFEKKVKSSILRSKKEKNATKVIKLHMQQRPLPRSNEVRYRKMLFKLSVHSNDATDDSSSPEKSPQKSKKIKHKDFGASSVVLMFVEPMKMEPKINRAYLLTHQDIYFTIHGLQGEIMYADQRIATITGYMPHDVQGNSAYQYIRDSDIPIALFAQKAMFTSNDGTGSITYRLKIFDSTYIYLQSKGQIVFKDNTTEMSHFVCYNKWLSEEEGNRELIKFQERYAPQISESKDGDVVEKSSSTQSPQQEDIESDNSLRSSVSMDQPSTSAHSENILPDYEVFMNDHPEKSSTIVSISSIQSLNGSIFMDNKVAIDEKISENYSVQSCLTELKNSKEKTRYIVDECRLKSPQRESYPPESHLGENLVSLQSSSFNPVGFTDTPEVLNGKSGYSVALYQSQDFNQAGRAYVPPSNLEEIASSSVGSGHNGIQFSKVPPEMIHRRPSLDKDFSSFTQICSSVQERFCVGKEKLPNMVNTNGIEKMQPKLNPAFNGNESVHTRAYCNEKYIIPRYESNGHYNMHSSYTSSKRCYQNFSPNEYENQSYAALNSVALPMNGKHFDSSPVALPMNGKHFDSSPPFRNGSCTAPCDAFVYGNGATPPVPDRRSLCITGDLYNHTNGFNGPNKLPLPMNGSSCAEVQKQIVEKNKPTSQANDAYLNPVYGIPAKRIKTDSIRYTSRSSDNRNDDTHILNVLGHNDCNNVSSDIDLSNDISNFFQDIKTSSIVGESAPIQRPSGSVNFDGELYNELEMFFEQLPLSSSCTPQSQLPYELAQSTGCDQPQLKLPSLSTRNVSS